MRWQLSSGLGGNNHWNTQSLGCSSIAMNLDEPYETGSTLLRHFQRTNTFVLHTTSVSQVVPYLLAVFQTTTMLRSLEKGKVHVEAEQDRADVGPPHYSWHLGRIHELAGSDSYGWNGGQEIKKVRDAVGKYRSRPEWPIGHNE